MSASQGPGAGLRLLMVGDHIGHAGGAIHGATTYYVNVLPRLQHTGVQITACFLGRPHSAADLLTAEGVETVFLGRAKWDLRALPDLVAMIRQRGVNVLHAGGMKGILLSRVASRITGVPLISHFHDSNRVGVVLRTLHRKSARWDSRALAISQAVGRYAVATLGVSGQKMRVLYNGIDPQRAASVAPSERLRLRTELGIPAEAPVIGVIGRFSPEKGHEPFIKALPPLLAARPDTRVIFAGDGACRMDCERIARELGLEPSVRFLGFRNDVPAILQAVDAVAIPSLEEGLSYTALESMAAGRPVVSSAVGGLPEIIRHGETGLLAAAGDMAGLGNSLLKVLSDVDLRDRVVAGGQDMVARLSIDSHVDELVGEYNRLLEGRGPT